MIKTATSVIKDLSPSSGARTALLVRGRLGRWAPEQLEAQPCQGLGIVNSTWRWAMSSNTSSVSHWANTAERLDRHDGRPRGCCRPPPVSGVAGPLHRDPPAPKGWTGRPGGAMLVLGPSHCRRDDPTGRKSKRARELHSWRERMGIEPTRRPGSSTATSGRRRGVIPPREKNATAIRSACPSPARAVSSTPLPYLTRQASLQLA